MTAIGRRKSAIARVRLTQGSSGAIFVNGKEYKIYFPIALLQKDIERPLLAANVLGSIQVTAKVTGGGFRGQAEALRLGIARGLLAIDPSIKKTLRAQGLVTRDSRVKERKKPGLKRARRAPQFSKR
ncbi:MAG: 30S ribosomal protein S9 [Patescibacteria group bacterium]